MRYAYLAILVALIACSQPSDDIVIGADYALTGSLSQYGDWANNGINLALEEINKKGIHGRQVKVIFEDSKGDAKEAVSAYHKLRNIDGVQYLITFQSSIALAIAPLANEDGVVQMDVSATTPAYSSPNDYTFRTGILATQLAKDAAKSIEDLGITELGVAYINNDYGQGMVDTFKKSYTGKILKEESFDQDANDFRTQLTKLSEAGAKNIFMVSHMKEAGLVVKQAAELGLGLTFYSDVFGIEGDEFMKGAGDASEGVIYVAPLFDAESASAAVSGFVQAHQAKHGSDPNYFAAQSYDGLMALATAMEACAEVTPQCVKDELSNVDFQGTSGKIKFDINGDTIKPVVLKTVKNGEYVAY